MKEGNEEEQDNSIFSRIKNFVQQNKKSVAAVFFGAFIGFLIAGPVGMAVGVGGVFAGVKYKEIKEEEKNKSMSSMAMPNRTMPQRRVTSAGLSSHPDRTPSSLTRNRQQKGK